MAIYTAPGVYWQDVFTPPSPAFMTGIPAFLGYATGNGGAADQYVNQPQLLTLWTHFAQMYGEALPDGYLAHAVRGFFENGGQFCYVVRLQDAPVAPLHALAAGLAALTALNAIDLVCVPDIMRNVLTPDRTTLAGVTEMQSLVLNHCQQMGDRFAILDALNTSELTALPNAEENAQRLASVQEQKNALRSPFGALYYPWLLAPIHQGNPLSIPPCGHLAGIYARSDRTSGVHKAPANEPVEGILDLRRRLTEREAGLLNDMGVNCIRAFAGRGMRVWGARTLGDDENPAANYVNVRRLFVTVSRWLEQFMDAVAFDANDIRLWLRIMREISAYCDALFRQGALKGRTAAEAFFVKCDSETNPSAVIEAGMLVTEIGLAPLAPSEFIVVRVIHGDSGVTIQPVGRP